MQLSLQKILLSCTTVSFYNNIVITFEGIVCLHYFTELTLKNYIESYIDMQCYLVRPL